MRLVRFLMVAALLLAASSLVWGDSLGDPQMIVDPPPSCTPTMFVSSPFTFPADSGTGLICFQRVDVGPAWLTLDIDLTGLSLHFAPGDISCPTDNFYYDTPCTMAISGGVVTDLLFTAEGFPPGPHPGIGPGAIFQIDIRPPEGSCTPNDPETDNGPFCWGHGDFKATGLSTTVPEPTSAMLLISGIGALVGKRRWFKRS